MPNHPLRSTHRAQASFQRHEHLAALEREYKRLEKLTPAEASGWLQRQQRKAACAVQAAWRRQVTRRAFRRAVGHALMLRRDHAARLIQLAQRTRRRIVREAAPPISQEQVAELTRRIGARTVAMAQELHDVLDEQTAAVAAADEPPALPSWLDSASWMKDLATTVGGGSMTHQLREAAARGLASADPTADVQRGLREWPARRAVMQASAVRRQLLRTQVAALHAQLLHPPPLPPVPTLREAEVAATLAAPLPPVMPAGSAVQIVHKQELLRANNTVDAEEAMAAAGMEAGGGREQRQGVSPRLRGAKGSQVLRTLELANIRVDSLASEELLWLASMEKAGAR